MTTTTDPFAGIPDFDKLDRLHSRQPIRIVLQAIEPQLHADVSSCPDCQFHDAGTVTMCEEHERLDINALFDRLV